MKRYRNSLPVLKKLTLKIKGKFNRDKYAVLFNEKEFVNYFWTDLYLDPDEDEPIFWSRKIPDDVWELRKALENLYQSSTRGPVVQISTCDDLAIIERLRALGYI